MLYYNFNKQQHILRNSKFYFCLSLKLFFTKNDYSLNQNFVHSCSVLFNDEVHTKNTLYS